MYSRREYYLLLDANRQQQRLKKNDDIKKKRVVKKRKEKANETISKFILKNKFVIKPNETAFKKYRNILSQQESHQDSKTKQIY